MRPKEYLKNLVWINNMIKQAMILAAGRGKRMMPLTKDMPKSMLKIGNMTLIEDKIVRLTEAGVERIIINTGYLGEYIRDHVGDGSKYGINIIISDEGLMPIGTANGIRIMLEKFNNEPFILVNADIWTNYLFIDLRNELIDNCLAHIILTPKPSYANGDFNLANNKIIKGNDYTYTGIGLYDPELFRKYDDKELGTILNKESNINAEIYTGLWDDIGTPDRLNAARKTISL